ncbi:MAG: VWA domain-containing protein [Dehalococcoidia bacterium]|nr:VWA domain-containing protein [Dehalococcoidia bacterium]
MTFALPWLLFIGIPVVLGFAFAARAARRHLHAARGLSRLAPPGPRYVVFVLLVLASLGAVAAAAGPRWGERSIPIERRGTDVIFVVDVSRSMDVEDVGTSRLIGAREAIAATLEALEGDRVGLVIFGGTGSVRFPLTTDADAAASVLQTIESGQLFVEPGSNIAAGLETAAAAFDEESDASRVVVLVSDGDDLGQDPTAVAASYAEQDITLLVAGVGTPEGGTVPVYNRATGENVPLEGEGGEPVVSALNEPLLLDVARAAGGRYLGTDLGSLPGALSGRITALQSATIDERDTTVPVERFQWFAGAALVFVLLALVAERIPRRVPRLAAPGGVAAAALLALLLAACAEPAYEANERGLEAYEQGRFDEAIDHFEAARDEAPGDDQLALNLAAALHADARYDAAEQAAGQALDAPLPATVARAHSAIGHARFAAEDLEGSLEAFRAALREDPQPEYRHDYEVVLRLLQPAPEETPGDDGTPGQGDGTPPPGEVTRVNRASLANPGTAANPGKMVILVRANPAKAIRMVTPGSLAAASPATVAYQDAPAPPPSSKARLRASTRRSRACSPGRRASN